MGGFGTTFDRSPKPAESEKKLTIHREMISEKIDQQKLPSCHLNMVKDKTIHLFQHICDRILIERFVNSSPQHKTSTILLRLTRDDFTRKEEGSL